MYKNYANPFELLDDYHYDIVSTKKHNNFFFDRKIKEDINIKKICEICCSEYSTSNFINLKCGHQLCEFCLIDIIKLPRGGYINLIPKCPFCRTKIKKHKKIKNTEVIDILNVLANKKNKSKMLKLQHNQKHCLCSTCNNIFIATSNCANDLNQLPTMCMRCYDKTSYTYNLKTCSWCNVPYIKLDGCNVVRCNCGGCTCDLCGERISGHDRIHFPGSENDMMVFFKNKCVGKGISELAGPSRKFLIGSILVCLLLCIFVLFDICSF